MNLIFLAGHSLNTIKCSPEQGVEFQKCVFYLQNSLEEIFRSIAQINSRSSIFVMCERGLLDSVAYLSQDQWQVLLNDLGYHEGDLRDSRYDLVIGLSTAAIGAEEHFNKAGNLPKPVSLEEARTIEHKLRRAWSQHPKYFLINNDFKNFQSKVNRAYEIILNFQGSPIESDFSRRYLIADRGGLFLRIVSSFASQTFELTDTILSAPKPEDDNGQQVRAAHQDLEVIYIRKRVALAHPRNTTQDSLS